MPERSSTQRVDELLRKLTPREKAGQLIQYFYFANVDASAQDNGADMGDLAEQSAAVEAALARGEVGALLFVRSATEVNRLQRLAVEGNRHSIPALFGFDVIHGLRTILPVPIALAASWDPDVATRGQAVAAAEARAVGLHWTFAPMVDVTRDPRWGRIVEGAGEDPYLGAAMAVAQVRGFQGEDLGAPDRIIAGPKHFAGYGFTAGGRDYDEVELADATLHNVVFPPFRAAVEAGAGNIMTAYMDLNGIPAAGNRWLFTDVLRDAWGFEGFVVSDAMAVHNQRTQGFTPDLTEAGARALQAGCDLEMAIYDPAYGHLVEALEAGRIREEDLDRAVRRVLTAKADLGLFDEPYVDEAQAERVLADPAHREVAREAAERSFVLLRNENDLLPLDREKVQRLAVVGPLADSARDILGPWVFDHDLTETVTVAQGLTDFLGDAVDVRYAPGLAPTLRPTGSIFDVWGGNSPTMPEDFDDEAEFDRAVRTAADADVAVVVVGEWQNMVGEQAARSALDLPGRQLELLQAVVATDTPTVLLVMSGRPLDLQWAARNVPAVMQIWYPGTRGGEAVARTLFGQACPAGRLPFTWPRTAGQIPLTYSRHTTHDPDHRHERYWDLPSTPLFPFGFGLGYGTFEYGEVELSTSRLAAGGSVTAAVEITNTGSRSADEVVQLYVHQKWGTSSRPLRLLKGFQRVTVEPGQRRRVEFTVGPQELTYWNAQARDWVLDAAEYEVAIGPDSEAPFTATFVLGGQDG